MSAEGHGACARRAVGPFIVCFASLASALTACTPHRSPGRDGAVDGGVLGAYTAASDGGRVPLAPGRESVGSAESTPPRIGETMAGRARHLLEAIGERNAELARDIECPRELYVEAFDAPDPTIVWQRHVHLPFRRDVRLLQRRWRGLERARFVSFELGVAAGQVTPKKKQWKEPLWRTRQSKLTFSLDGEHRTLTIAEMMAWKGDWYVTRLR